MKYFTNKIVFTFIFALLFTSVFSESFAFYYSSDHEFLCDNQNDTGEEVRKIYVSEDQILINSSGIFIDLGEKETLILVDNLFYDDGGIFTIVRGEEPRCGHGAACKCGGCSPRNVCPYRCKCAPRRR